MQMKWKNRLQRKNQTLDMEMVIILVVVENCPLSVPGREAGESKR